MKKELNFFLDMDGVLCDFLSGAIQVLNRKYEKNVTIKEYAEKFGKWETYEYYGITEEQFWAAIHSTYNFWGNLAPMNWAIPLYKKLCSLGKVTIITTPSSELDSVTQKIVWLEDLLEIKPPDIFVGSKKYLMAGNGILIDDNRNNVDKFIKAGGEAILVPSNWNNSSITHETVWSHIQNYLDARAHNINLNNYLIGVDPYPTDKIDALKKTLNTDPIPASEYEKRIKFHSGMVRDTNNDKPRFDLVWPDCIPYKEQMIYRWAVHMAKGAAHYSARNWEKAEGPEELDRFRESAMRHFMQWYFHEEDEDHASAVFFNINGYEMVKSKINFSKKPVDNPLVLESEEIFSEFQ